MRTYTLNANGFWIKDVIIHEAQQINDQWSVMIEYWVEVRDQDGNDITSIAMQDGRQRMISTFDHRPSVFEVFGILSTQFTTELFNSKKSYVGVDLKLIQMLHPVTIYIPAEMPTPEGAIDITPITPIPEETPIVE